tara:strand:- start:218 stop:427 length:210 start_codon:yes stop_codon:yes gene_type:complete
VVDIHVFANYISFIGNFFGLFSRVPQVYQTYATNQQNILLNCLSVITLESSLIYMERNFKDIKSSSGLR